MSIAVFAVIPFSSLFTLLNIVRMEQVIWLFDRASPGDRDDIVDSTRLKVPFIDLLASVDAVLTKPGYGTYAEAVCNATPLLTLARSDWPETSYLNLWAAAHGRVAEIDPAVFRRGDFTGALDALWSQTPPATIPVPTGVDEAAERLLNCLPG